MTSGSIDLCEIWPQGLCTCVTSDNWNCVSSGTLDLCYINDPVSVTSGTQDLCYLRSLDMCQLRDPVSLWPQQTWNYETSRNLYLCNLRGHEPVSKLNSETLYCVLPDLMGLDLCHLRVPRPKCIQWFWIVWPQRFGTWVNSGNYNCVTSSGPV